MYDFIPSTNRWKKTKKGTPASEKQQKFLVELGWGRDNLTKRGAWYIIDAIINS